MTVTEKRFESQMPPSPVRRSLLLGAASFAGIWASGQAHAAAFPEKPIKLVVPFSPGGSADVVARVLAEEWQQKFNVPVVVESRVGGGGVIAAQFVANAPPDGHTLLLNSSAQALNESLFRKLPYDPATAFKPVALVVPPVPYVLVVHPSVPATTVKELVAFGKANPSTLKYGSAGIGNGLHVGMEMLSQATGAPMLHVPYKGAAQALNDLLGGQINVMLNSWLSVAQFVKDGKLRVLAQTSLARSPAATDVPTVAESGYPGFDFTSWFAVYAPGNTPAGIVEVLNQASREAVAKPEARAKLAPLGAVSAPWLTSEQFASFHRTSADRFGQAVRKAGIALD